MELRTRAIVEFDASHTDSTKARCGRQHGHRWAVAAEEKILKGVTADLETDLHLLISEWRDRDVDEMMHAPGKASPHQMAANIFERLLMGHPGMVSVEVSEGRVTGIAMQVPR